MERIKNWLLNAVGGTGAILGLLCMMLLMLRGAIDIYSSYRLGAVLGEMLTGGYQSYQEDGASSKRK